jgi:anion-transporting  ArsA/GET3 family ATPase
MAADRYPGSTLADKRLVVVTGKGGVGKTTVCAASALGIAARGKRVLVAMCNAKERLSTLFGVPPIGHPITPVAERIWATNIQPDLAMQEYGELLFRSRTVSKAILDNPYVSGFLRAVPGMPEWAMLGKAWWHTTERLADGSFKYDVVMLDAPATGHGLDMLRVPSVILDAMPPGLLRRDADLAWTLMKDPASCAVVVVTLAEEMPVTETIELTQSLGELGLPIAQIVVNAMLEPLFSKEERTALEGAAPFEPRTLGEAALAQAKRRAAQERLQGEHFERLTRAITLRPVVLPMLIEDVDNLPSVEKLARRLGAIDPAR